MVDFIDEVNEELRRERLTRFWEKMGRYIIAVSALIVGVTVASVLWDNYKADRQENAANAYLAAEKLRVARQFDEAQVAFDAVIEGKSSGYASLARLKEASLLREQGKNAEAEAAYLALVGDRGADEGLRAFARIYAAQLMVASGKPFAEIETVLKPLTSEQTPFGAIAKEQLALAAYAAGDAEKARELLEEAAASEKANGGLRQRTAGEVSVIPAVPAAEAAPAKAE